MRRIIFITLLALMFKNYQSKDYNVGLSTKSLTTIPRSYTKKSNDNMLSGIYNMISNGNLGDIEDIVKNITTGIERPLNGIIKDVGGFAQIKNFSLGKTISEASRVFTGSGSGSSSDILRDERLYFPSRKSSSFDFFGKRGGGYSRYF